MIERRDGTCPVPGQNRWFATNSLQLVRLQFLHSRTIRFYRTSQGIALLKNSAEFRWLNQEKPLATLFNTSTVYVLRCAIQQRRLSFIFLRFSLLSLCFSSIFSIKNSIIASTNNYSSLHYPADVSTCL